jgi:hypothetical protein
MKLFSAVCLLAGKSLAEEAITKELKTVEYATPQVPAGAHLFESFDAGLPASFVKTSGSKQDEEGGKYAGEILAEAAQANALPNDLGMVLKSKAAHSGIATELSKPFSFVDEETFVLQYEVNFQDGIECGGAYVKLLSDEEDLNLATFDDKTKFTFMFGPDKCSSDYKLHFIFNYKNPKTGEFEEKHLKNMPKADVLKPVYSDAKTHIYRLVINSNDNTFSISVDNKVVSSGNLLTDLSPAINPEAEIVDTNDSKPESWDDREMIPDPDATKPENWDESAPKKIVDASAKMPATWREDLEGLVDDPEAVMPEDWDEDMDGEYVPAQIDNPECAGIGCGVWEAPVISNPEYKGKWKAKHIKNPEYSGVWKARMIANPDYFEDLKPFASAVNVKALAVEVWTMSKDIMFDNFYLGNSVSDADIISAATFAKKQEQAKLNEPSLVEKTKKWTEENKLVVYIMSALAGIPLLYLLYRMIFGSKKVEEEKEEEEEEEKQPEPEFDMVDEVIADDEAEKEEEAIVEEKSEKSEKSEETEESAELGAGDSVIEEPSKKTESGSGIDTESDSESEDEPEPESKGPRRRANRRKAD